MLNQLLITLATSIKVFSPFMEKVSAILINKICDDFLIWPEYKKPLSSKNEAIKPWITLPNFHKRTERYRKLKTFDNVKIWH